MDYKILEVLVEFNKSKISRVTVLVDCTAERSKPLSDVRAIYATTKPRGGYMNIPPSAEISNDLLQKVAAAGMETEDRDKLFHGWKKKIAMTA